MKIEIFFLLFLIPHILVVCTKNSDTENGFEPTELGNHTQAADKVPIGLFGESKSIDKMEDGFASKKRSKRHWNPFEPIMNKMSLLKNKTYNAVKDFGRTFTEKAKNFQDKIAKTVSF